MTTTKVDFNDFAKDYRELHSENLKITGEDSDYFSEYKIKEITRFFETNQPFKVLDYGCGDGNSEVFFEKYFSQASVFGIDISEESIIKAKERTTKRSQFIPFNGLEVPYENDTFDLVYTACVFHHIDATQHHKVLSEMHRVLKKGGKLIVFEHNPVNPFTRKLVRDCVFDEDAVLIYSQKMKEKFHLAGFVNIRSYFTLFMPRHKFLKPFLFLEKYLRNLPIGGQYYIIAQK